MSIHLPPPMKNVRVSKYYENQGYPASQIREPKKDERRFKPQAQSSPPTPRASNSQHGNIEMPSPVSQAHATQRDDENDRDDDDYRQDVL